MDSIKQAINYFKKSAIFFKKTANNLLYSDACFNLSDLYFSLNELDSALHYANIVDNILGDNIGALPDKRDIAFLLSEILEKKGSIQGCFCFSKKSLLPKRYYK